MNLLALLPLLCWISIAALGAFADPEVRFKNTKVVGSTTGNVELFLGLPFAKPPVGNLRLRPPVLVNKLEGGSFNATKYGPSCLQMTAMLPLPVGEVSEDCLTLNVFRPVNVSANAKLPVMIFIYGGGFSSGSATLFHGVELVSYSAARGTPILYVSFNYRLGPLGFPVGKEAASQDALNVGLHDQVAVLEWLKQNIHFFGGDKSKITVFGESAGGSSLSTLLTSPKIDGLARAAILESPAALPILDPKRPAAETLWSQFIGLIPSCASSSRNIECLRRLEADSAEIAQAMSTMLGLFQPSLDGPRGFLPKRPSQTGFKSRLPLIVGSMVDEGTYFTPQTVSNEDEVKAAAFGFLLPPIVSQEEFDRSVDTVLKLYPDDPTVGSPFGTGNATFGLRSQYKRAAAIFGDEFVESWRRTISLDFARRGINVWGFQFADANAAPLASGPFAPGSLGIPHGSELPYVFGFLLPPAQGVESSEKLSEIMRDYWISFATTLDPNDGHGNSRPVWPKYTERDPSTLKLNGTSSEVIKDDFRREQISFFQNHPDFSHR